MAVQKEKKSGDCASPLMLYPFLSLTLEQVMKEAPQAGRVHAERSLGSGAYRAVPPQEILCETAAGPGLEEGGAFFSTRLSAPFLGEGSLSC